MRVNYLTGCILNKGFVRKLLSGYIITLMLLMSFSVLFAAPGLAVDLGVTTSSPENPTSESVVGGEGLPRSVPNTAPDVSDIPDQEIAEGETFTAINLDYYVYDLEDPPSAISWSYDGNSELTVDITDHIATVSVPDGWYDEETITFTAEDTGGLSGSDEAIFTVNQATQNPPNFPPAIPEQVPGGVQQEGETQMGTGTAFGYISEDGDDTSGGSTNPVTEPQGGGSSSSSDPILTFIIIPPENAQYKTGIRCIEITTTKPFAYIGAIVIPVKPQNIPDFNNKGSSIMGYTSICLVGDGKFLTNEDIASMNVKFKVNKTWMDENDIDNDSVAIEGFRQPSIGNGLPGYNKDGWESLPLTPSGEDEEYFYYEVDAPGCSATFAIIGTEIVEVHPYSAPEQGISWTVILGVIIASTVLLVVILFKAGYIYTEEEHHLKKPQKTHKPKINKIRQTIAVLLFWI